MDPNSPSETPLSPKPRPATPHKPDRLRGLSTPLGCPGIESPLRFPPVVNGGHTRRNESVGPPEYYADVEIDNPAPQSPWAPGAVLSNGEDQTKDTVSSDGNHVDGASMTNGAATSGPKPPESPQKRPQSNMKRFVNKVNQVSNHPPSFHVLANASLQAQKTLRAWPRAPSEHLCDLCKTLELTIDKFVIDPITCQARENPHFWGKREWGTLEEIKLRQPCTLCRLLIQAFPNEQKHDEGNSTAGHLSDSVKSGSIHPPVCYLYWTVDGRERVQEGQSDRVRTIKRTRRLCIEWTNAPHDKAYIVLVAPDGRFTADGKINNGQWERPTLFLGRLLTSLQQTPAELIRSWLDVCTKHHKEECKVHEDLEKRFKESVRYRSTTFTVIDVKSMRLTSLPEEEGADARYVALSYTWGEDSRTSGGHGVPPESEVVEEELFKTTTENVAELEAEDGIRKALTKNMPEAIQNAIYLTDKLGYRYLWVDSLCIIQNDTRSWDLNAEVMDVVYGNAEFTICAADGHGARDGLKALFPPENSRYARHAQEFVAKYQLEDQQPLQLILSRPSESYILKSRWNKRAWTFQERMLSRRCIIFVAGRMYFQCRTTTMSEDIYSEAEAAGWSVELHGAPARMLKRVETDPVFVYKQCLGMYTQRKLTHEKDVLAAFSGISNIIHGSLGENCEPVFGLPNSHFDWALLWEPEEKPEARHGGKKRFPTWSWCGWKGGRIAYNAATVAGLEVNLHEWLLKHTWITYYIRDGEGSLRLVWDPLKHESSNDIEERWRGYDSPKIGLPRGSHSNGVPKFDYHGRPWNNQIPHRGRVPGFQDKQFVRTVDTYRRRVAVLPPGSAETRYKGVQRKFWDDERYLQFWTWSAEFLLGEETPNDRFSGGSVVGPGLRRFAILDAQGDFAGSCILDESWSEAAQNRQPQQFIALSDARDFDNSEYGCWNFYSEDERDLVPWQLFNVMMIWYEEGKPDVAYRGGIGKVYKSAFGNGADDGWKEIVLG